MTESTAAAPDADDARLLNMVRAGDPDAFALLYERHSPAARRLARLLASSAHGTDEADWGGQADDLLEESFARVLEVTRRGGGPSNAVRPYVLTVVRRGYAEQLSGQQIRPPGDDFSPRTEAAEAAEPGEPYVEPGMDGLDATIVARAYLSLPGSWRAVLWHAEVEHASAEDLAPVLGLDRNGIAALRRQASDGLRQACLRLYLSGTAKPECTPVVERLGVFLRDAQSVGDTATVTQHLTGCADCRTVYEELADVRGTLRATVAPLVLGPAADRYLAGAQTDRAADTGDGPAMAAGATDAPARTGRLGHVLRPYRLLAAATAAALAGVAVIAALAVTGNGSRPARGRQQAAAPFRAAGVQASPTPSSSASPTAAPTPVAAPPAAADPVVQPALSASIDVSGQSQSGQSQSGQSQSGQVDQVVFQVTDSGPASTGALDASIVLPPGVSVLGFFPTGPVEPGSGTNGRHHRMGWLDGTWLPSAGGWTCKSAGSVVTCTHDPVAAGSHVEGVVVIMVGGSSACGQPVRLTVTSSSATAAAAADIPC